MAAPGRKCEPGRAAPRGAARCPQRRALPCAGWALRRQGPRDRLHRGGQAQGGRWGPDLRGPRASPPRGRCGSRPRPPRPRATRWRERLPPSRAAPRSPRPSAASRVGCGPAPPASWPEPMPPPPPRAPATLRPSAALSSQRRPPTRRSDRRAAQTTATAGLSCRLRSSATGARGQSAQLSGGSRLHLLSGPSDVYTRAASTPWVPRQVPT
mmetsp:Transcript_86996/g.274717  ORF Transcript_86996/g.274717 Transcript_86996/m.274717 type:complete len:211 (-) Transcript_86996:339-971(-)